MYLFLRVCQRSSSALARPTKYLAGSYLAWFFVSNTARQQLQAAQRGIKNSLGLDDIRNVIVPLAPLERQNRIVTRISELLVLCDQLESKLENSRRAAEKLLDAIVHHITAA